MLAPNSSLVALQGVGYEPNADIQFKSESEGEHHDGQLKADSEGNFFFFGPRSEGERGCDQVERKLAWMLTFADHPLGQGQLSIRISRFQHIRSPDS
jgi:hypothetical protein